MGRHQGITNMTIKTFLSIIAALGVIHGIAFVIAPGTVDALYGLPETLPVALMSRFFGGALIAWGGILWATRSFRDEDAIRSILQCTAVAEFIGVLTAVFGTAFGTLNAMGWLAAAIYVFGTAGCVYFLSGERKLASV
jgi:hypothetical protein